MADRSGTLGSAGRAQPVVYGQMDTMFKFLDLSLSPSKNDRSAKLGQNLQSYGVAVCDIDPKTLKVSLADGLIARGTKRSLAVPEPDNWVYRIHDRGRDRVWAIRLVSDHTNKHNERKNRSSMVIDQQDRQRWGHLSEVFWVKDVGVDLSDPDLQFNGAGILKGLCAENRSVRQIGARGVILRAPGQPQPTPTGAQGDPGKKRYHTAFNVNREAGFVTDGKRIGQLRRIVALDDWLKVGANADGEPLVHAALPSDVYFSADADKWGPLAFHCADWPLTDGKVLVGYHWWFDRRDQCRTNNEAKDQSEDGKEIPYKQPNKNVWVFVRLPRENVPTGGGVMPPDAPSGPYVGFPAPMGGAAGPGVGGVGAFNSVDYPAGVLRAESGVIPLPEEMVRTWGINVEVEFVTPAAGIIGPFIRVQFDYCVIAPGGDAAPIVPTGSIVVDLTPAGFPGAAKLYRLVFHVPHSEIKGAARGKISWALGRRGDIDASPSTWHVVGRASNFSPKILV